MIQKVRVYEIAKDLDMQSKDIIDILGRFNFKRKNHMSTLEDNELDIVMETLTQKSDKGEPIKLPNKNFEYDVEKPMEQEKDEAQTSARPAADKEVKKPVVRESVVVNTRAEVVDTKRLDTEKIEELVSDKIKDNVQSKQKMKKGPAPKQPRRDMYRHGRKRPTQKPVKKVITSINLSGDLSVGDLAAKLQKPAVELIKKLMAINIMASVSDLINFETAELLCADFGVEVLGEVKATAEEILVKVVEDKPEELKARPPVVVVMGHVDHGKTSLLDAIRKTNVTEGEAGGITQHIGAYRVKINDKDITFLDTPGHEAFTAMRARGAQVTDIAILVVAADDGIMPQTIEAINHAKAAGVSIIVAINKMDKPGANPDRVKQELMSYSLVPEDWGGDTICANVSAINGEGIDELLQMILLVAEMKELKSNPDRLARGTVIEAKLDKGKGPVATILVQSGTLQNGNIVVAGTAVGRVRAMTDDKGGKIIEAGPSVPVEITGLDTVPDGGDMFYAVESEKIAKDVVEGRIEKQREEMYQSGTKITLDNLFSQIEEGKAKELNIVIKADVQGSVEAVRQSLEKLDNEEVRIRIIHGGVGAVNDSDIMLASASNAIIVGFNVRPDVTAISSSERLGVDIRLYRVIYNAIEEIEAAMKGMLEPKFKEVVQGHAEIRQVFKVTGVGTVAGCYVQDGKISRNAKIRVVRDGIVIHEGILDSLKRFKDDAKEVATGYECGMGIENFNDIKEGDILECYNMEEIKE